MPRKKSDKTIPIENLRWRLDPSTLPFQTTDEIKPLREIIGQQRAVEAFQFPGKGRNRRNDPGPRVEHSTIPSVRRTRRIPP